jgi:glycine/D-amino acid oxidase-like deaminating enzyme
VYPADDAPLISAVTGAENLYLNSGHWAGIMLSAASGRLMADVVTGKISDHDNVCRLGRFSDGSAQRPSTNKFGGWG